MHKHPLRQRTASRPLLLVASLLFSAWPLAAITAVTTTPPPIVDTEPPTNITLTIPGSSTHSTIRPVITLDMATEVASSIVATDAVSSGSPSTDFPGTPSGTVGPLAPGRHTITWTATDLGNNSFSTPQQIDVLPQVNLAVDQTVGEGNNNVTVTAYLSGAAPLYPVTLNYTIGGTATGGGVDHDATGGTIVINSPSTSGSISFKVLNDALTDPGETIIFDLDTGTLEADRVIVGNKTRHTVTITETNLTPIITIAATQNGGPQTHAVTTGGGLVTLSASAYDPNGDTISGYDWSASDNALAPTGGTAGNTFSFDPTGLTPGIYTARLTVNDGNAASTRDMLLRVYTTAPALSTTDDSDDDGVKDSIEGIGDSDDDGIPNYLDAVSNLAWLPGRELLTYKANLKRSDTFVAGPITFSWQLDANAPTITSNRVYYPLLLATEPGLKLSIGPTAFANGSNHGRMSTTAAALHFGSPLPSTLISADGQVVDVEISGLGTTGQSVYLIIPQAAPLPATASFKIMSAAHLWQDFVNGGAAGSNTLLFTNKESDGYCPTPADSGYTAVAAGSSALNSGISCIELLIQDGGPNDYDGKANGIIRLLGAPFINVDGSSNGGVATAPEFNGTAEGSVESLNKISLSQGGGGVGFIGLWGVMGLLLAHWARRRQ